MSPSTDKTPLGQATWLGLWCGALSGLFVAMGDYGAMWLWLPLWRDRGGYLLRMLGLLTPVGALLGALSTCLGVLLWRAVSRTRAPATLAWPAALAMLSLPLAHLLARKLCSGGMMSRLSQRALIEGALTLLLPLALFGVLWLGVWLGRRTLAGHVPGRLLGAGLLALAFALGKVNQLILPNLYDYLHACLGLTAWASAALGFAALLHGEARLARARAWATQRLPGASAAAGLALVFALTAWSLDRNLNVRVAMFDARSPTSRNLLAALDPALRALAGDAGRSRGGPRLSRPRPDTSGLPTQPGAHVLLVTIDALRADHLGSYGYARDTSPHLDAFAAKAVQFDRAYAQAPHSSYSLSSLHTSEYLHEVVDLGRGLPTATLATTLAESGYHTAAFFTDGIFHTEGHRLTQYRDSAFGFALYDHTNRPAQAQTDRVLAEVDRVLAQGEPPSLFWVHYFDVHEPYEDTHFGTGEMDRYDSEIRHVDRELWRLIRSMDERLERPVIIAITADHGEEFREHGGVYHGSTLFDEQVRVPLILRAPGLPSGRVEQPVELVDVAPTLLGAVGVAVPSSMRGRDLRALALGRGGEPSPVFSAVLTKRMGLRWPHKLIADLRFGLYELYDLSQDPEERRNLASSEPERLAELRGLVYGWLDSLEAGAEAEAQESKWLKALRWGRLGDRRAVQPMAELLLDPNAPTEMRVEAGQILAKLADESSAPALVKGMDTKPFEVAAEAAIALGRMYDARARDALRRLVHVEDPFLRARAAVSLGRLRDVAAVPALIDALWVAPTQYEREEAVRWLGRLRDRRAVEPLLSLLPEFGLRYLVTVALGQIGDPRVFGVFQEMLGWEHHTNSRDELVRGFGFLGDARAIAPLVEVLAREPALKNTAESLIRLGALERGYLGGTDVGPDTRGLVGFGACQAGPLFHDWDYLGRTTCTTTAERAELRLALPRQNADWTRGAQLVMRMRAAVDEPLPVRVSLGGELLATVQVDTSSREFRTEVPSALLSGEAQRLTLEAPQSGVVVDHALLVPEVQGAGSATHTRAAP